MDQGFITDDRAAQLLSELLWQCREAGQNESGFHNELAGICECDPSTIANWQNGRTKPGFVDVLRLCAHLGESFAKPLLALAGLHVGLEPSAAELRVAELEAGIARLLDKDGETRVVPIAGKIS